MRIAIVAAMSLLAVGALGQTTRPKGGGGPNPFDSGTAPNVQSQLDKVVLDQLRKLNLQPANICTDAVFLRRIYVDLTGTIPTAAEAAEFIRDRNPAKRRLLIDRLMQRDEFADYWALKWCDLLRVKSEFPVNLWPNAVEVYHHWIRTCMAENKPYDKFARQLLTSSGSNFRMAPVNFFRAVPSKDPPTLAQNVALILMGERTEKWPAERLTEMSKFFAQVAYKPTGEWKEEVVFFDPAKNGGVAKSAKLPDGTTVQLAADVDPREVFADWLINEKNPSFARNIVNRQWSWLMGRGIIHEPDDLRPDNPPVNPELLALLEKELIGKNYDLRHVFQLICNSRIYQMSHVRKSFSPEAEKNFAFYPVRRLDAEVMIDALCQITNTTEKYISPIPEPYTYIPENQRSISLADGSISSSFLELFGRPTRDFGLESERNNHPTARQRLHMLNSSHIQRKIEQSPLVQGLTMFNKDGSVSAEAVATIYLTVLSRYPTDDDMKSVNMYARAICAPAAGGGGRSGGRELAIDLIWALFNTPEFQYRH